MKALSHLNVYFYKYKSRLILGIIFVSISTFFAVYPVQYTRMAIDYIKLHIEKGNIDNSEASVKLMIYGLLILGMTLLQGFFMFLMRQTIIVMSRLIEFDLKNEIYRHYQLLDISFYRKHNTGDLMNRISEDVGRVRMYIGPAIMYVVNTIVTFALTIIVMINADPKLTLYVLIPFPLLALAIYFVSISINKKSSEVQAGLSDISSHAQETFSGIRVIKAYNKETLFSTSLQLKSKVYKTKYLDLVKTEALFMPFMTLLVGLSTIITVYIGGSKSINGEISIGNIAEFIIYVNKLTWPIASLGWVTSLIQRAAASQERINEFLKTQPSVLNNNNSHIQINGNIEFKHVSFTYKDSGIKALNDVSFHVKMGESLAIIGKTGSGKSTISNLICRLFDTDEGEILIDEKNIKSFNLGKLRESIGYVPQEVFLFSDTIRNNINFSSSSIKNHAISGEQVIQAAKDAAIYKNIESFPDKFETIVGERGITLSGGQKQRISIARAIIKSPQILLFDDCLSAVDTETEEEILINLKRLMKGKTTIIISHRVSSVKHCDNILVLDNGKITESGSHEELIAQKGNYYHLNEMQMMNKDHG